MSVELFQNVLKDIHSGFPILLTGSGFSTLATNANSKNLMTGGQFTRYLNTEMGFTKEYPLDIVTREYREKFGEHVLFGEVKSLFTAVKYHDAQKTIFSLPWKRVYTTNYDNVSDLCLHALKKPFVPVNATSSTAANVEKSKLSVIHLNGRIADTDFRTFDESIRLTRASYLTDSFMNSSWPALFRGDLSVATAIVICGYSAYDIDIARILYSDPVFRQKTYFLETIDIDPVFQRELEQFGTVIPATLADFAKAIDSYSAPTASNRFLVAFTQIGNPATASTPSGDDVEALLLYGDFKPETEVGSTLGNKPYTVNNAMISDIVGKIKNGDRYFLIHSDLGNGKTIFSEKLSIALNRERFSCFRLNEYDEYIDDDLFEISRKSNPVIIVEDIFRNAKVVTKIVAAIPNCPILATTRSAIYELRYHRIEEIFAHSYAEYDLNKLNQQACEDLSELIDQNGLWSDFSKKSTPEKIDFIRVKCESELRNVLIALFESPTIRERIINTFNAQPDSDALKVLATALLLDVAGFYPDSILVNQFTGIDIFKSKEKINNAFSMEFIHNVRGSIRIKSSIFGEYVLQNVMSADYIVDRLIDMVRMCERGRSSNSVFHDLQKEIIRFSFVDRVFKRKTAGDSYKRLYDSIKDLPSMARNPQFWLQYAIARLEDNNFRVSEIHFRTAYSHASRIVGYDTFQIDNHYARFLLESRTKDGSTKDDFKAFIDAHNLLLKQAKKERDAYYPYKVARSYYALFKARGNDYGNDQLKVMRNACNEMINEIVSVPKTAQKYYVIDECYRDLQRMITELNMRIR